MTKKNQQRRFFHSCLKWLLLLGLRSHELTTDLDELNPDVNENSSWRDAATVETRSRYRTIRVTGDKKTISDMNDDVLDEIACHEIVHAVLAPLNELFTEVINQLPVGKRDTYDSWRSRELEEVTTHLEVTVRHLYKAPKGK